MTTGEIVFLCEENSSVINI